MKIKKDFFDKNVEIVAKNLLGKIIVRKIKNKEYKVRITETEAYYGENDPASWARFNGNCRRIMSMEPGTILIKMVHNNYLLNFVTGKYGKPRAVLIRAGIPLNFNVKCNGPGLLTRCLKIDKKFNEKSIFKTKDFKIIDDFFKKFKIFKSFRIGVKKDLKKPLRFYIK
ncbi:MAG: DNA-3-methyladenine glycosylase [Candidatus Pacearchaeota archaeon]